MATAALSGKPRRRKLGGHHDEEHENHERWLITYADMITLLMVLFIVLYSISQVDLAKFRRLKDGLAGGFGGPAAAGALNGGVGPIEGGGGVFEFGLEDEETILSAAEALAAQRARATATAKESRVLAGVEDELRRTLAADGLASSVQFRTEDRGLVVTIVTDQVLFPLGEAELTSEGRVVIDHLAPALGRLPNRLAIEGHTDNIPISGRYPSNWELSTARASAVLREMVQRHGIPPEKMQASGYADQRPLATQETPEGRAANRRVEIVVLSDIDKPVDPGIDTGINPRIDPGITEEGH